VNNVHTRTLLSTVELLSPVGHKSEEFVHPLSPSDAFVYDYMEVRNELRVVLELLSVGNVC